MTTAKRPVRWGSAKKVSGQIVQRSICDRYELIESPAKMGSMFSVTLNPNDRGTYLFRVLFVERSKALALSKLEAFEAERAAALAEPVRKAA